MKRYRPRPVAQSPVPDNPYRRFFTPMPTFEQLVRTAREREKRRDRDRETGRPKTK